ncbi:unnamed protein product [Lactuca saligna]|uniref:Uncharacterized protein n=1 Tax=Lactuca saligna TaxID=75948 RepID=A0AA35YID4_LACSI|nr:unnamed protein product [Lactuca saligna]
MDALTLKTEMVKVLMVELENVEKQVSDLLSEKAIMKSCIEDVNVLLSDINETRDSVIIITVKKHLLEKLRPVFAMVNRLEGVLESCFIPKTDGEEVKQYK